MEAEGAVSNCTDCFCCNAQAMGFEGPVLGCAHLPLAAKGCGVAVSTNKRVKDPLTLAPLKLQASL